MAHNEYGSGNDDYIADWSASGANYSCMLRYRVSGRVEDEMLRDRTNYSNERGQFAEIDSRSPIITGFISARGTIIEFFYAKSLY